MSLDEGAGAAKRAELEALLRHRLGNGAERFLDAACTVVPPLLDGARGQVLLRAGGGGGAVSLKPGNILLDARKLLAVASKGVIAAVGVAASPWSAPLAFLVLWDELWSRLRVEIGERDATVLWAMWIARDEKWQVAKDAVADAVAGERARHGRRPLSEREVKDALALLLKLGCIDEARGDRTHWWLREQITVQFPS